MPASTLQGRLLCASNCAYAVRAGEDVLVPEAAAPFYAGVGFNLPPRSIEGGREDINACVVGTSGDGIVVAIRGTLPIDGPFTLPMLLDWVNDLNAAPIDGNGLPGQVHEGFLGSLDSIWLDLRDEIKRQRSLAGAATPIIITGHSKGGAVAALAAMRLFNQESITVQVVTFAAPKPGNAAFCEAYNAVIDHTRYEDAEDVVPHLPPSSAFFGKLGRLPFIGPRLAGLRQYDYERVGSLLYIKRSGEIVADPENNLLNERRDRIAGLILLGHIQQIADDHRSGCGYGYMSKLCPIGVCPLPIDS